VLACRERFQAASSAHIQPYCCSVALSLLGARDCSTQASCEHSRLTVSHAYLQAFAPVAAIGQTPVHLLQASSCTAMEPTATHSSSPASSSSSSSVLQLRQKHYGKNAALSYKQPLHIVRGQGCYLYDEAGTEYLDCVNNVASVGHANPQVTCRSHVAATLVPAFNVTCTCHVPLRGETLVVVLRGVSSPVRGSVRYCMPASAVVGAHCIQLLLSCCHTRQLGYLAALSCRAALQVAAAVSSQLGCLYTNSRHLSCASLCSK
jgi:hypothetical protein